MTKCKGLKKPAPSSPYRRDGRGPSISDLLLQEWDAPALEVLHPSKEEQETFVKAVLGPPPISPALARAFRRRRKLLRGASAQITFDLRLAATYRRDENSIRVA